jgi:hypothetical protein
MLRSRLRRLRPAATSKRASAGRAKKCKVEVDPDAPKVKEGSSVTLTATVLPDHTICAFTVNWQTADGTGKSAATSSDGDFTPQGGTLTFGPGVDTQMFTVTTNPDARKEPDETFFVNMTVTPGPSSDCAAMDGDDNQITITIQNNH